MSDASAVLKQPIISSCLCQWQRQKRQHRELGASEKKDASPEHFVPLAKIKTDMRICLSATMLHKHNHTKISPSMLSRTLTLIFMVLCLLFHNWKMALSPFQREHTSWLMFSIFSSIHVFRFHDSGISMRAIFAYFMLSWIILSRVLNGESSSCVKPVHIIQQTISFKGLLKATQPSLLSRSRPDWWQIQPAGLDMCAELVVLPLSVHSLTGGDRAPHQFCYLALGCERPSSKLAETENSGIYL